MHRNNFFNFSKLHFFFFIRSEVFKNMNARSTEAVDKKLPTFFSLELILTLDSPFFTHFVMPTAASPTLKILCGRAATETAEPKARRTAWYLYQGGALSLAIEQGQIDFHTILSSYSYN